MANSVKFKKADSLKRLAALVIDYIIASVFSVVPIIGWAAAAAYMLLRDGFNFDFMRHRSLGKQIMKLKVVDFEDKTTPADLKSSALRNWLFAAPFVITIVPLVGSALYFAVAFVIYLIEGVKVSTDPHGRRYGDEFAKTIVIEE